MVQQAAEVTLCISERLANYLAAAQDAISAPRRRQSEVVEATI